MFWWKVGGVVVVLVILLIVLGVFNFNEIFDNNNVIVKEIIDNFEKNNLEKNKEFIVKDFEKILDVIVFEDNILENDKFIDNFEKLNLNKLNSSIEEVVIIIKRFLEKDIFKKKFLVIKNLSIKDGVVVLNKLKFEKNVENLVIKEIVLEDKIVLEKEINSVVVKVEKINFEKLNIEKVVLDKEEKIIIIFNMIEEVVVKEDNVEKVEKIEKDI